MKEIVTANWAWINYVVMAVVPVLIGLLTKASWPSLVKFGLVVVAAAVCGLVTMEVKDLPWTVEGILPFIISLVGTSQVFFMLFVNKTGLKEWLAKYLVSDTN